MALRGQFPINIWIVVDVFGVRGERRSEGGVEVVVLGCIVSRSV